MATGKATPSLFLWSRRPGGWRGPSRQVAARHLTPWIYSIMPQPMRNRGVAMGLVFAGTSAGASVMTLATSYAAAHAGWRAAYLLLALPMLVVALPLQFLTAKTLSAGTRRRRSPGPCGITNRAHRRGFRPILRNVRKLADWMVEQGGFEPSVSREVFPKENTRECWDISDRNRLASFRE